MIYDNGMALWIGIVRDTLNGIGRPQNAADSVYSGNIKGGNGETFRIITFRIIK